MLMSLALAALLHSVPDAQTRTLERLTEDLVPSEVGDLTAAGMAADALTLNISASFRWLEVDGPRERSWAVWATLAVRPDVWWRDHVEVAAPRACAELPRMLSPQFRERALEALGCPEGAS